MFRVAGVAIRTSLTALVLAATMMLSACWFKPEWVQTALKDLPVLVQMAESIVSIIAVTKTGRAPSPQEINAIQNISTIGTAGLQGIQALYNNYNSGKGTTTVADIQAACTALNANLKDLLAAAQIKDPALLARVTAAVGLITGTVDTFLSLLPQGAQSRKQAKAAAAALPSPQALRTQWHDQVGSPLLR